MSQAEASGHGAASAPHTTLWVFIGTRRIDFGVFHNHGRSWVAQGEIGHIDIKASADRPSLPDLLAALPDHPPTAAAASLRVVVADSWLAIAVMPWHTALRSKDAARHHALEALRTKGFAVSSEDVIEIDTAPYGMPRLAVAYPHRLVDALQQWTDRGGMRFNSLLPLTIFIWSRIPREGRVPARGFAWFAEGILAFAACRRVGRLVQISLSDFSLRPISMMETPVQCLPAIWNRLCLREIGWSALPEVPVLEASSRPDGAALPPPFTTLMEWPDGTQPAERSAVFALLSAWPGQYVGRHPLDGQCGRGERAWTLRHWAVTGLLTAGLLFCVVHAAQQWIALHALRGQIATLSRPPAVTLEAQAWTREERLQIQAVNAAARELNWPVNEVLRSLVPPQDVAVGLLGIETSGSVSRAGQRPEIRITALARTGSDMTRYVSFVSQQAPFVQAYLTRHEVLAEAGELRYRFTVDAEWDWSVARWRQ